MDELRLLVAFAFTGLLVMLRLEADRFGAAEYAEADRWGQRPPLRRRLGWYGLGILVVVGVWVAIPDRDGSLFLRLGDRIQAIGTGFVYAGVGIAQAVAFAWLRYRHLRLPAVASYPVALLNSVGTAFIDEVTFRGALLGFLILIGLDSGTAVILQALAYGLACRLGAPGRDRYMFVLSLLIGLTSGELTIRSAGIGAAFFGHAVTRFATFVATGHAGQPAPYGRETEDIEKTHRTPDGWSTVGTAHDQSPPGR